MKDNNGNRIKYSSLTEAKRGCDKLTDCAFIKNNCGSDDYYELCTEKAGHPDSHCGTKLLRKGIYRNYNLFNRTSHIFI